MGQRERFDDAGACHHVVNRAVGEEALFTDEVDRRQFIAQLARAARHDHLMLDAFCLLRHRFHVVMRTERGTLSEAMRLVQQGYARWFNRRHGRRGSLIRGRFASRRISSHAYLRAVVPYVDHGSVRSGLASSPRSFGGGSAQAFLADRHPPHLRASRVLALLGDAPEAARGVAYGRHFGAPPTPAEVDLIETRFRSDAPDDEVVDHLVSAPEHAVLPWVTDATRRHAGSLKPAYAVLAPIAIEEAVARARLRLGPLHVKPTRKRWDAWRLVLTGLQHTVGGLGISALAARHGVSVSTANRYVVSHRQGLDQRGAYQEACGLAAVDALRTTYARTLSVRDGAHAAPVDQGRRQTVVSG